MPKLLIGFTAAGTRVMERALDASCYHLLILLGTFPSLQTLIDSSGN